MATTDHFSTTTAAAAQAVQRLSCATLQVHNHRLHGDCSIELASITKDSGYRDSVFKTHQYSYDASSISQTAGGFIQTIEPEMTSTKYLRKLLIYVLSGNTPDSQTVRDIATSYNVLLAFSLIGIILAVLIIPTSIFIWRWQNRRPYKAGTQRQRRLRTVLPLTLAFFFLIISIAFWSVAIIHNTEMREAVEKTETLLLDVEYDVNLLIYNEEMAMTDYLDELGEFVVPMMEKVFADQGTMMSMMTQFPQAFAAIMSGVSFDSFATSNLYKAAGRTGFKLDDYLKNVTALVNVRAETESRTSENRDLDTLTQFCTRRRISCNDAPNSDTCSCILPPLEKMNEHGLNLFFDRYKLINRNMGENLLTQDSLQGVLTTMMSFADEEMFPSLTKYLRQRYSKYATVLFPDDTTTVMPGTQPTPPIGFSTFTPGPVVPYTPPSTQRSSPEEMLRYYERIRWSVSLGALLISMWQVVVCVVALVLIAAYRTGHFVTCLGIRLDHFGCTCIRIGLCFYLFIQFFLVVLASIHFLVGGLLEKSMCGLVRDTTHSAIAELLDAREGEKPVWVHALEPNMVLQIEVLDENIYEYLQVSKLLSAAARNQTAAEALNLRNLELTQFISKEFDSFNLEEILTNANITWSSFQFRGPNERERFRQWREMGIFTEIDVVLQEDLLNTKVNPGYVPCHACALNRLTGTNSVANTALRVNQSSSAYMREYDSISALLVDVQESLEDLKNSSEIYQAQLKELDDAFFKANENFATNSPRIFGNILGPKLQQLLSTGFESALTVIEQDLFKLGNMWGIWWGVAHQYLCGQLLGNMNGFWFALGLHLLFSFATSLCAAYILLDLNQQHRGSNLHDTTHTNGIVNKGAEFQEFTDLDTVTSKEKREEPDGSNDTNSTLGKSSSSTSGTEVDGTKDNNRNTVANSNEPDVTYAQF